LLVGCIIGCIIAIVIKNRKSDAEVEEGHVVEEQVLVNPGYVKEVVVEPGQQIVTHEVTEKHEVVHEVMEAEIEVPDDW
tara:strand:- start:10 stop:246 length:237 start_codon:yes stop_codon:yes gene_type:complete